MSTFNRLEAAALAAMAAGVPDHEVALLALFRRAAVTKRENTGAGFFTYFTVDRAMAAPLPLTVNDTGAVAEIAGLESPLLLSLFWKDGYPFMLEGATCGHDTSSDTSAIDFGIVSFKLS